MFFARIAQLAIVCIALPLFSAGSAAADENPPPPPALIGLPPGPTPPQPRPTQRKLWIALGVVSGVALAGAIVAVGVTLGTSAHDSSVFHDWGTVNVTRR